MLYNVLIFVLVGYALISPYFYAKALKFGLKIAQGPEKASEEKILEGFNVPKKAHKPKMTPEEQRTVQILANIDRYDGTSAGQKKVKVNV